jgi:hypothetical protein
LQQPNKDRFEAAQAKINKHIEDMREEMVRIELNTSEWN